MTSTLASCGRRFRGGQLLFGLWCVTAAAVFASTASGAFAAPVCACDSDVNRDGEVNLDDYYCFDPLWWGGTLECPNTDVNCDGVSDACDWAVVACGLDGGGTECCDIPCGACCGGEQGEHRCQRTTAAFCADGLYGRYYAGDGVACRPSPCDCNFNGTPDHEDIAEGTSDDCNDNGTPDECEWPDPQTSGACCLAGGEAYWRGCGVTDAANCASLGGTYSGNCTTCPEQNLEIVDEPGGDIFVHVIGPPIDCSSGGGRSRDCVPGAPLIDSWESLPACHNFGAAGAGPIPADFFGPGSDAYDGLACLDGEPLGPTPWGEYGDADTLIERSADPFDRCSLPSPTPQTVDIEIVALSLVSTSPITVTYDGGMNPEDWDVAVDLSTVTPPAGSLTATKTHCNGGMYTSQLNVLPRFTFTKVGDPATQRVLDTGEEGLAHIVLEQSPADPWVHDVNPLLFPALDPCSDFHASISDPYQIVDCDCQPNGIRDKCDIEGPSDDDNGNGIPDECEGPPPDEACCMPDGSCVMMPEVDCMAMGGIPQGPGTVCTTAQACCWPDNTCAMVDPLCCGDLGGTVRPGDCGGREACCDDVGACYMANRACCAANGDTPKGAGSVCLGDANGNGIDDACEEYPGAIPTVSAWGLLVLTLLLLVAAKVYFNRRAAAPAHA